MNIMDDHNEGRFVPNHSDIIRDIANRESYNRADRVDRRLERETYSKDKGKSIAFINFGLLCFLLGGLILAYIYLPIEGNDSNVVSNPSAISVAPVDDEEKDAKRDDAKGSNNDEKTTVTAKHKGIKVYVVGAVKNPGIFSLPFDSRVDDAIQAAGGLTDKAEPLSVNLAKRIKDEDKIFVSSKQEDEKMTNDKEINKSGVIEPHEDEEPFNSNKTGKKDKVSKKGDNNSGLVNVNIASEEELQRVPGIGPSISKSIVDHRNKLPEGKFNSKDQLKDVAGIGKANYKKIEPYVDVR